uniref:Innexin n=1 Tax=Panagrellus redivivus TaxID=6233 RepID=A0A7E4UUP9_PANRE
MDFIAKDISPFFKHNPDGGDVIDELNYHYTALLLVTTGLTHLGMLYVARPIQCWLPAEFTDNWEQYVETLCFVGSSRYFSPEAKCDEDGLNPEYCMHRHAEDEQYGYYQWVPLILLFQSMAFAVPGIVWRHRQNDTGINVKAILTSAAQVKKKFDKSTRSAQVQKAASHLLEALEMQRELKKSNVGPITQIGKTRGIYLVILYLFTKLLYVLNVILQFVILNAFLGPQYTFWGVGILQDLINGREWTESGHFPRVTLCDFNVRVLGNIHRWTVQCVLMINMFNEKIFLFFWFWFLLVGVLSVLSLVYWLFATAIGDWRIGFVSKYLRCTSAVSDPPTNEEERQISGFVRDLLRPDGVFLLRLIQTNGGDLLVGEITTALFNRYKERIEEKNNSRAMTASPSSQ